jgi:hypothetical protein
MTELSEHAKSILRAIADGKEIEHLCHGKWAYAGMVIIGHRFENKTTDKLRIKLETRSINGVTFPAPDGGPHCFGGVFDFGWTEFNSYVQARDAIIDALNGVTK